VIFHSSWPWHVAPRPYLHVLFTFKIVSLSQVRVFIKNIMIRRMDSESSSVVRGDEVNLRSR
jgi:hypothetical protein